MSNREPIANRNNYLFVRAVPAMIMMMIMTSNKKIMGKFTVTGPLRLIGWIATFVMGAAASAMAITSFL